MGEMKQCLYKIPSVAEWNKRVLTSDEILTGKEFRRLKRAGKIDLFVKY